MRRRRGGRCGRENRCLRGGGGVGRRLRIGVGLRRRGEVARDLRVWCGVEGCVLCASRVRLGKGSSRFLKSGSWGGV